MVNVVYEHEQKNNRVEVNYSIIFYNLRLYYFTNTFEPCEPIFTI